MEKETQRVRNIESYKDYNTIISATIGWQQKSSPKVQLQSSLLGQETHPQGVGAGNLVKYRRESGVRVK